VEDLFYNVPQRRKAFKAPSEEYAKILDVVGRYAIHRTGVAFSCKKFGDASASIAVSPAASTVDRIRQIHGGAVANELINFELEDNHLKFKATGWATNANYHVKKTSILLFINHRSVESSAIKTAIQRTYSTFLPKGDHPWVYLSLEIAPERVDVNVHPTKREVNFLNEDEIIEMICEAISSELAKVDTSRTFLTQSLMPSVKVPSAKITQSRTATKSSNNSKGSGSTSRPYENNLVRTDPALRKITSMLPKTAQKETPKATDELEYTAIDRPHTQIRLVSIKDLRATVRDAMHEGLTEVFASHTFVGIVDTARRIAAIQNGVKLYLIDYGMISNEYFYQVGLTDFNNFGTIEFEEPLDIRALIKIATSAEDESTDFSAAPEKVTRTLIARSAMLREHFNMDITPDGYLKTIPLLVKGYMPPLAKLPRFLLRLGPCVIWDKEQECFETFLTELASFYTPEQLPNLARPQEDEMMEDIEGGPTATEDLELKARRDQLSHMIEHVLFPAFRSRLVATKGLLKDVVEVADLKGLYRVFERC
jgi:DNA mismatch repair protein MLH1